MLKPIQRSIAQNFEQINKKNTEKSSKETSAKLEVSKDIELLNAETKESSKEGIKVDKDKALFDLTQINDKISGLLKENNFSVEFSIDESSKRMVVKYLDAKTNEVIDQLPPKITMKLTKFIAEQFGTGQITDETV